MVNFAFKLNKILDESVSTENPRDELLRRHLLRRRRNLVVIEGGLRLDLLSPRHHLEFFLVGRVGDAYGWGMAGGGGRERGGGAVAS